MGNQITQEGLKEYEAELEELTVVRRKEVAEKLKEARAQGDLSENAEYDAAKDEQRDIEARIAEIEEILKNAEVYDADDESDSESVHLQSKVRVKDMAAKEELTFKIVSSTEAKSFENKISNESPLGKALIGHKAGQTVKVEAPIGELKYKILEVDND